MVASITSPGWRNLCSPRTAVIGRVEHVTATRTTRVEAWNTGGIEYPWGTKRYLEQIAHEVADDRPEASSMTGDHTLVWEAELSFRSDYESFYYRYTRRLLRDGVLIRERAWEDTVQRDYQ